MRGRYPCLNYTTNMGGASCADSLLKMLKKYKLCELWCRIGMYGCEIVSKRRAGIARSNLQSRAGSRSGGDALRFSERRDFLRERPRAALRRGELRVCAQRWFEEPRGFAWPHGTRGLSEIACRGLRTTGRRGL